MARLPKVRSDLVIVRSGPDEFFVRDPKSGESFALRFAERWLMERLDGQHAHPAICREYTTRFGKKLRLRELDGFIEQLRGRGLFEDIGWFRARAAVSAAPALTEMRAAATPAGRPTVAAVSTMPTESRALLNAGLDLLAMAGGWIVHRFWILPVLVLAFAGLNVLVREFSTIAEEIEAIHGSWSLAAVVVTMAALVLVFISLPNAILTGVACRVCGGRVRGIGLRFYRGLIPYFACDTGESIIWMDDRGRWAMLSLRLWSRAALVGLVLVGWQMAPPDSVLRTALLMLIVPSVVGLFLRLNVLHPLEGCQLLAYGLGVENLRRRAMDSTKAWLLWRPAPEALSELERFWFRVYGVLAYLWLALLNFIVIVGGGALLVHAYGGVGAGIGLVALLVWHREEIERLPMFATLGRILRGGGPWWVRWPIRLALLAGLVACGFIPYHQDVGGDFRLVSKLERGIRAPIAGEVEKIHVADGQEVEVGTVIATLVGRDERANVATTEAALEKALAEVELLKAGTRPEVLEVAQKKVELAQTSVDYYKIELDRVIALEKSGTATNVQLEKARFEYERAVDELETAQEELGALGTGARAEEIRSAEADVKRLQAQLAHYREELELITIKSPIAGHIVTRNIREREGQYVQQGDMIALVQSDGLEVEIATSEDAAVQVRPGMIARLHVNGLDGDELTATVVRIGDRAIDGAEVLQDQHRTDRENLAAETLHREGVHYIRVFCDLNETPPGLVPDMTGYARITVQHDIVLWEALWRPLKRFLLVEVWSWLP